MGTIAGTLVLTPHGDITFAAERCRRAAASEVRNGVARVRLDMSGVGRMDGFGWTFLRAIRQRCHAIGTDFEIEALDVAAEAGGHSA